MVTLKDKIKPGQLLAVKYNEGPRANRVYDVTFIRFRKYGFVEVEYVSRRIKDRWCQVMAEFVYLKG